MHTTSMVFKFGRAFSTDKQQFHLEIEKSSDKVQLSSVKWNMYFMVMSHTENSLIPAQSCETWYLISEKG